MAGTGMTSSLLVPPACSLCCLFPGGDPLEVFRAGYVSCSCTEDLSPHIVINFLARWPLHIIFFLCAASLVSGVLPTWNSFRADLYVSPLSPKLLYRRCTMSQTALFLCIHSWGTIWRLVWFSARFVWSGACHSLFTGFWRSGKRM